MPMILYYIGGPSRRLPTLLSDTSRGTIGVNHRFHVPGRHTSIRMSLLPRRGQRIIAIFRIYLYVRTPHPYHDLAVSTNPRLGRIGQGVLISSVSDGAGISPLDISLR